MLFLYKDIPGYSNTRREKNLQQLKASAIRCASFQCIVPQPAIHQPFGKYSLVIMVTTRSGHDVFHTESSYGRAANIESKRRRLKKKLESSLERQEDKDGVDRNTTTPRRQTRAQLQQMEELSTPPSASNRVGITPPRKTERLLRGRLPTCSDYGITRHFSFRGNSFFFCHPCDMWDSLPPDRHKLFSRASARFACTAHHGKSCNDDHDDEFDADFDNGQCDIDAGGAAGMINNQPMVVGVALQEERGDCCEQEGLDKEYTISQLKDKIQFLRQWNLKLARDITKMRDEAKKNEKTGNINAANGAAYQDELLEAINCVTDRHNRRRSASQTSALVAKAVWNHETFHTHLVKLARKHFRATVFTPFNILREMDLAGGHCRTKGSMYYVESKLVVLRDSEAQSFLQSRRSRELLVLSNGMLVSTVPFN